MANADATAAVAPGGAATYDSIAQTVRWLFAALALGVVLLSWTIEGTPRNTLQRDPLLLLHRSVGATILAAMVLRTGWRWWHPPPPLPHILARLEIALARFTHFVLYQICILMPLTGVFERGGSGSRSQFFRGRLDPARVGRERPTVTTGDRDPSCRAIPAILIRRASCYGCAVPRRDQTRRDRRADAAVTPRWLASFCTYQAEPRLKEIQRISEAGGDAEPLPPALHAKLGRARRWRRSLDDAVRWRLMGVTEHREQRHSIAMIDRVVAPNAARNVSAIEAEKLVQLTACEIYRPVFRPIIA